MVGVDEGVGGLDEDLLDERVGELDDFLFDCGLLDGEGLEELSGTADFYGGTADGAFGVFGEDQAQGIGTHLGAGKRHY